MKNAGRREQLGRAVRGTDFRYYDSLEESVKDFVLYLDYTNFPSYVPGPVEFVQELKDREYFEESFEYYFNLFKSVL